MAKRSNRIVVAAIIIFLVPYLLVYNASGKYGPEGEESLHNTAPTKTSKGSNEPGQQQSMVQYKGIWLPNEVASIPRIGYTDHKSFHGDPILQKQEFSQENRLRYESSDIWRLDDTFTDPRAGSSELPRLKVPPRSYYDNDGQYLRQSLLGDFNYGADKIFYMLKTGADTQWNRMPMHFMTDLTHAQNFALYSDAPGSIFGHEIINIVSLVPQDIIDERPELRQYRAHLQSHNEHWNWNPEKVTGFGGWMVDRFKNIPMLWDAYKKNPKCEWYIWVDDDSYVFYDNLVMWLETMNYKEMIYTGAASEISFNGDVFNFAHGGSVVAVSHGVAEALFGPVGKRKHNNTDQELLDKWMKLGVDICCGDAMLAYMVLKELDLPMYIHPDLEELLWYGAPFQGDSLSSIIIPPRQLCTPVVTWHHLSPHDMELLYTYERLWSKDRPIFYSDIYQDFFLPYIAEERQNWWISESGEPVKYPMDGGDVNITVDVGGQTYQPAISKSDCKQLCTLRDDCSAWSWRYEHCVLQTSGITLGSAANSWNDKSGSVSGWMVDRIRNWRAQSMCDRLQESNGVFNDNISTSEGWMLRWIADNNQANNSVQDNTIPL